MMRPFSVILLILALIGAESAALAGSLTIRFRNTDYSTIPTMGWCYVCDMTYKPLSRIPGDGVPIANLPDKPLLMSMFFSVPNYGNLEFTIDNGGAGYMPQGQTLDILYEAARSRYISAMAVLNQGVAAGYTFTQDIYDRMSQANSLIVQAGGPGYPGTTAQAQLSMQALQLCAPASEDIVLQLGRQKLDAQGGVHPGAMTSVFGLYEAREGSKWWQAMSPICNGAVANWHWQMVLQQNGTYNWNFDTWCIDDTVNRMNANYKNIRGHCIVWMSTWLPGWYPMPMTFANIKQSMITFADALVARYPTVKYWNISNEANNSWDVYKGTLNLEPEQVADIIGAVSLETARLNPNASRGINTTDEWSGDAAGQIGGTPRIAAPYEFLDLLKSLGVGYEYIGMQTYFAGRDMFEVDRMLERYSALGKRIRITEMSAPCNPGPQAGNTFFPNGYHPQYQWRRTWDEGLHADWLEGMFTVAMSKDYVDEFNWWDLADYTGSYLPWGGLLDPNYVARPAYYRMKELVDRWGRHLRGRVYANVAGQPGVAGATVQIPGTYITTTTDANGNYSLLLNEGSYPVQASCKGFTSSQRTVSVSASGTSGVDFALGSTPISVATAKGLSYGFNITVKGIVTSFLPSEGRFTIESEDRACAISGNIPAGVSMDVGDEVIVGGTTSGMTLRCYGVARTGRSVALKPVGATPSNLMQLANDQGVDCHTLLMTTWGKAAEAPALQPDGSKSFRISDVPLTMPAALFSDNFDAGRRSEWTDLKTATTVQSGKLVANATSSTSNLVVVSGMTLADATVSADALSNSQFGIVLRCSSSQDYVTAVYGAGNMYIAEAVTNTATRKLVSIDVPVLGANVTMTASVSGNVAAMTISDGALTYSTSCALTGRLTSGLVGLVHNTDAGTAPQYFDNFSVYPVPEAGKTAVVEVRIPTEVTDMDTVIAGDIVAVTGIAGVAVKPDTGPARAIMLRSAADLRVLQSSGTLFVDYFTTGRRPEWVDYDVPMVAQGGKLVASCPAGSNNATGVSTFNITNVTAEVDGLNSSVFGILLRWTDGGDAVLAGYSPWETGYVFFHEISGGDWGSWFPTDAPNLGPNIHLTASVNGSLATVTATDGTHPYTATHTLAHVLGPGTVGLFHNGSVGLTPQQFDNFMVR